jgi:hypothetical protein
LYESGGFRQQHRDSTINRELINDEYGNMYENGKKWDL